MAQESQTTLDFTNIEIEIQCEFEEYKRRLLQSESRKNAMCEAYHAMAVSWNDYLQCAENKDDADFIKAKVKLNEEISERYMSNKRRAGISYW